MQNTSMVSFFAFKRLETSKCDEFELQSPSTLSIILYCFFHHAIQMANPASLGLTYVGQT
jgi:hypothetical protein